MFKITFWGVRGSTPCCGKQYNEYGGHTCCVSVQLGNQLVVLDAGTGMVDLGKWMVAENIKQASILLTHTHFDHVLGLPFFTPLWMPGATLDIYAGHLHAEGGVKKFFQDKLNHPLFPGSVIEMAQGTLNFHDIKPGTDLTIAEDLQVKTIALQHPGGSTGYRLNVGGKSLCYITDTEHLIGNHDSALMGFIRNTDCLIYDATYTSEEHREKIGWGHSTWQEAVYLAKNAGVQQLVIYHHNHLHDDTQMSEIEDAVKKQLDSGLVAKQGMVIDL